MGRYQTLGGIFREIFAKFCNFCLFGLEDVLQLGISLQDTDDAAVLGKNLKNLVIVGIATVQIQPSFHAFVGQSLFGFCDALLHSGRQMAKISSFGMRI